MKMKSRKAIFKLFIYAAVGFGLGFLGAFLGDIAKLLGINAVIPEAIDFIVSYVILLQVVVGAILSIVAIYYYTSVKKMITLEVQENDEDEDLTKKIDLKQDKALTISAVNYIFSFALFGIFVI